MIFKKLKNHICNYNLNRAYFKKFDASVSGNFLRKKDLVKDSINIGKKSLVYKNRISGKVSIGSYCSISHAIIRASDETEVRIGSYSIIQGGQSQIVSKINDITIGKFCTIGFGAVIIGYSHRTDTYTYSLLDKRILGGRTANFCSFGDIQIGHDCTIGMYSFIMPGVSLGNGCIVLPNSVVTSSFEPYTIIAGNPAVKVGIRFSQKKIDYLNTINWYEWPHEKIVSNIYKLNKRVRESNEFD